MIMSMRKATMLLGFCLLGLSLAVHAGDMMKKGKMMNEGSSMQQESMMDNKMAMEKDNMMKKEEMKETGKMSDMKKETMEGMKGKMMDKKM